MALHKHFYKIKHVKTLVASALERAEVGRASAEVAKSKHCPPTQTSGLKRELDYMAHDFDCTKATLGAALELLYPILDSMVYGEDK